METFLRGELCGHSLKLYARPYMSVNNARALKLALTTVILGSTGSSLWESFQETVQGKPDPFTWLCLEGCQL